MFVNYFRAGDRDSPLNLAVARVLLGTYLCWRGATIDTMGLVQWPVPIYPTATYLYPRGFEWIVPVEKWLLVAFAVLLIVGYRTKVSAFMTGLLMAHLAALKSLMMYSGETQQMTIGAVLVLLFGLYAEHDHLSIDGLRRTRQHSLSALNGMLTESADRTYSMAALRWPLVVLALVYFGAGWVKAVDAGLFEWTHPNSLGRYMLYFQHLYGLDWILAEWVATSPLLLTLAAWGTIITEFALLVVVILGLPLTPVMIALLGMHVGIILTMGVVFFDVFFFLMLFAAFDRGYARLVSDREIDLVYDEHCYFCARSLYPFTLLDINGTVTVYSQSDAPDEYRTRDDVDAEAEMYVFADGEAYGGYWAFRELLRQFWFTVPLAWIMSLSPVATVGGRVYDYIATNRNRYFVCS